MAVSREDLELDRVRQRLAAGAIGPLMWTDAQLEGSLQAALAARPDTGDVWIFAYGSLIWNPLLHHTEKRPARLAGYHRGFYLRSRINRGTLAQPGLVLGLDRGGTCRGIVMRIPFAHAETELRVLWRREMLMGSYLPRWLPVRTHDQPLHALAFVVNRASSGYAGRLDDCAIVDIVSHAKGAYGSGADYLLSTCAGLLAHGIRDERLLRLRALLLARHPQFSKETH